MVLLLAEQFIVEGPPMVLKVIEDAPFYRSPEFWIHTVLDIAVAAGTIGLALVTWLLAKRTKELATDAEIERLQADRHHRQQLSGIIVLKEPYVRYELGEVHDLINGVTTPRKRHQLIITATALNPCAGGPALSGAVYLSAPNININEGQDIGTFPPGHSESIQIVINDTLFEAVTADDLRDCELTVSYKNIFNEYRVTEYRSMEFMPAAELAKPERSFQERPINMDNISEEPYGP